VLGKLSLFMLPAGSSLSCGSWQCTTQGAKACRMLDQRMMLCLQHSLVCGICRVCEEEYARQCSDVRKGQHLSFAVEYSCHVSETLPAASPAERPSLAMASYSRSPLADFKASLINKLATYDPISTSGRGWSTAAIEQDSLHTILKIAVHVQPTTNPCCVLLIPLEHRSDTPAAGELRYSW
jgi:hypothetical protein